MRILQALKDHVAPYWKSYVIVLLPIVLLPLPLLGSYDGPDDGKPHKVSICMNKDV
jgi:hypothetical protein